MKKLSSSITWNEQISIWFCVSVIELFKSEIFKNIFNLQLFTFIDHMFTDILKIRN